MGRTDMVKQLAKSAAGRVGKAVLHGLNRADEIGGEVRDYILARTQSPTFRRIAERLARVRGRGEPLFAEDSRDDQRAQAQAAAAAAAPPPTAAELAMRMAPNALGNPELPAQLYGKNSCPWTGRAMTIFKNHKVDFDFIDLDEPENSVFVQKLVSETKQNTIPYVYLRGEFIGGYHALDELTRLGQLEYTLMTEEEKQKANPALRRVTVARREHTDEVAPGEMADRPEAH